jgi:hypothetical protein
VNALGDAFPDARREGVDGGCKSSTARQFVIFDVTGVNGAATA